MNEFSWGTRIYIFSVILVGLLLYVLWLPALVVPNEWLLVLAVALASLLQTVSVSGSTARSSYSLSWILYAFTLVAMGPAAAVSVILVAHFVEWLFDPERLAWYIQLFNVGSFAIATSLAALVLRGAPVASGSGSLTWLLASLVGLAIFTLSNHLLVGWAIRLARGQSLGESGVFGTFTLVLDFGLLCLGLLAAIVWQVNPVALVVVALIAYLLYETLKIPALERRAETDAKTGLFNSAYFMRALEEELARAIRFERPMAVIMADLDLLRNVNNTYGHLAGDVVLQGVARHLQGVAGEYDVVCRFGGEEFAVLMPESTVEKARARAEKVRQAIADGAFEVETSLEPIKATMSFGVAAIVGENLTAEQLLDRADKALYQAKSAGRNRVRVFGGAAAPAAPLPEPKRETEPAGAVTEAPGDRPVLEVRAASAGANGSAPEARAQRRVSLPLKFPVWAADAFIVGLAALTALLAFFAVRGALPFSGDWSGLLYFALLGFLVEYLAVEIYVRDTTVSTSAALLVAGVLLFGPLGAIVIGPTIALAAYWNQNQRLRALLFNSSNHSLAGLLVATALGLAGDAWPNGTLPSLLMVGAAAGAVVFVSTTYLLSAIMTLSNGGSLSRIWRERFRWLAAYYIVLGGVAGGLVFSYLEAGVTGILLIAAPLFMMRYSQKQYLDHTANMVRQLREANEELLRQADEIAELNEDLLLTLARSVDLRDPYVMEHSKHVARYAVHVARELNLPPERVEIVRKAGLLHDIGKLGIPDEILFKPSRLTFEEYETMKQHVEIGADLIRGCHSLHRLIPIVRHHHEWYNGKGYPDGLATDEIMLEARILALADAVEAMASDRPYHGAMLPEEIAEEVHRCAGSQFDPEIVQAFVKIAREEGEAFIVNSARSARHREAARKSIYLSQPPHV